MYVSMFFRDNVMKLYAIKFIGVLDHSSLMRCFHLIALPLSILARGESRKKIEGEFMHRSPTVKLPQKIRILGYF